MEEFQSILRGGTESGLMIKALLLFIFLCLILCPASFAQGIVTEQDIRDAILERNIFTKEELSAMDLNEDDVVDVADLVDFLKSVGINAPVVDFEITDPQKGAYSELVEGEHSIGVKVVFSKDYHGILDLSVSGTAQEGKDFNPINRSIQVNGQSVHIPIAIKDDLDLEEQESIVLTLNEDSSSPKRLIIGPYNTHTIWIKENDSRWQGTLQVDRMVMGFEMIIKQDDTTQDAMLVSDGGAGFPASTWPVDLSMTEKSFSASIGPMVIDADKSLINTAFERSVELIAEDGVSGHVFATDAIIIGNLIDRFESQHKAIGDLEMIIPGTFTLVKDINVVSLQEPELIDDQGGQ
jgi:hypothetical protein